MYSKALVILNCACGGEGAMKLELSMIFKKIYFSSPGSPFSCMVDNIDGSYVTAFGAGLVGGMSGQMVSFTVTAKQGSLSKSTTPLPVQIMPILLLPN